MYNAYQTISRDDVKNLDRKNYDVKKAIEIFAIYPAVQSVDFCTPHQNYNTSRYVATPLRAIYVKAASGSYGKPARLIVYGM